MRLTHDCVAAFGESDLQELTKLRGYRENTIGLLLKEKKIGIYQGCVAFPVEDRVGRVVGAHYQFRDGSWRYTSGTTATPLVISELVKGDNVHVFQKADWDISYKW